MNEFCFFYPRNLSASPLRSTLNRQALHTVLQALADAWGRLETFTYYKCPPFSAADYADEDALSDKLAEILNDGLDNNTLGAFKKSRFQTVVREGRQATSTLSSTGQKPDFAIRMMRTAPGEDRDEAALFVEAKLIDSAGGCREYVVNGLHRFVSGKYAPRVTFALMLGYSSADCPTPDLHLAGYWAAATSPEALLCKSTLTPSKLHGLVFESEHQRQPPCPGPFRALHLWVPRP